MSGAPQRTRQDHRQATEQERLRSRIREAIAEDRVDAAFDLAEQLLDAKPDAASYEFLLFPIERSVGGSDSARLYDLLHALESDDSTHHRAWRVLLRFALLERLEWHEEACTLAAQFKDLPERYAWMRYNRATVLMNRHWAYDEAWEDIAATRRAAPDYWQAAGTLAECALCQGRAVDAFAIMDECITHLRAAGRAEEADIATAWCAELRLWVGDYAQALAGLSAAAAAERPFALCWHGAASLLLGDAPRALASLDTAARLTPRDFEVYVWRGETYERLGQWDQALADFDHAAKMTGMPVWPLVGRALVKRRIGDGAGVIADFKALPRRIATFFQWKTRTQVESDPEKAVHVLLHMRKAARGLRRTERYLEPVWMQRNETT
jgi:tetratricopeptide (TPR) repeat protein